MSSRLALTQIVGESMIHIMEPVADQSIRYILGKLGLIELMQEIHLVSDFREVSTSTDENKNAKLINYRTVAKLNPSINPSNNKWEGMKTAIDLGNGNTLIRSAEAGKMKRPWSGNDITSRNFGILHDDDMYLDMTEWNVGSTLTMEVKMDFRDLSPAQEALSNIFATFLNGDMIGYLPIQYDYPIPNDQQRTLRYLYSLSKNTKTEVGFRNWLKEKSGGAITWNKNRDNLPTEEMVGLKNNVNAMFLVECSQEAPEVGQSRYTVTFNLSVQYSRVNRIIMEYPIVVNNNVVSFDYVPCSPSLRTSNKGPFQWQNEAVTALYNSMYTKNEPHAIHFPWWDEWSLPYNSIIARKGFKPIFIAAVTLDNPTSASGVTTIDIKEGLPGYKLSTDILTELNRVKSRALGYSGTYINLSVFAHDYQVDPTTGYYPTSDETYKAGEDYYTYNKSTGAYSKINTTALIGEDIPPNVYKYGSLLEFDGRYLKLKSRRLEPNYRLVISLCNKPVNMPEINWVWIATIIAKKGN